MSQLTIVNPKEFFRGQVASAADLLNLEISQEVEYYIVNLLVEFINPYKSGIYTDQANHDVPLALTLKSALEAAPPDQVKILKSMGDSSLYLAGYFQTFFEQKSFDKSYYIAMGSEAYHKLSRILSDNHFKDVYENLAHEFRTLVKIIGSISEPNNSSDNKMLLEIYERWTKSQSEKLERILQSEGIEPRKKTEKQ